MSRFRNVRAVCALLSLVVAASGCAASTRGLPATSAAAANDARSVSAGDGGVFRTLIPNFNGKKGPVMLTLQISSKPSCGSYLTLLPVNTKRGTWSAPFYEAPVTLTAFKRQGKADIHFEGSAKVGHGLGTLTLRGTIAPKKLTAVYDNPRFHGLVLAHYAARCSAYLPTTQPPPSPSSFVGTWYAGFGPGTAYPCPCEGPIGATMNITSASIQNGDPNSIQFSGTMPTQLFYFGYNSYSPPYSFTATWSSGNWLARAFGPNAYADTAYTWGTTDWYPPNPDQTNGTWEAYADGSEGDNGALAYISSQQPP